MFIVRGYGSSPQYSAMYRGTTYAIPSTAWTDVPDVPPMSLPGWQESEVVDGYKLKVHGSGLYTVAGLSGHSSTGCQIRIVRNSVSDIVATGPASAFSANTSNTTPVDLELQDGELLWLQVAKGTTLTRNMTSCSLELNPVL